MNNGFQALRMHPQARSLLSLDPSPPRRQFPASPPHSIKDPACDQHSCRPGACRTLPTFNPNLMAGTHFCKIIGTGWYHLRLQRAV